MDSSNLNIIRDRISKLFKNRNGVNKVISLYREVAQTNQPTDYDWLYGFLTKPHHHCHEYSKTFQPHRKGIHRRG